MTDGPWIPMQFMEIDLCEVDTLIEDPDWIFEQKFDGTRGVCVVNEKEVWWPGAKGVGELSHTAATQHLPVLNPYLSKLMENTEFGQIVLDGEIMVGTGDYYIWDILYFREGDTVLIDPNISDLKTRRKILEALYERLPDDGPIKLVRQATNPIEKKGLYEDVKFGGGEGVMAKRLDGKYESGKRVDHTVKLKFVKTADVVVLQVNRPDRRHGNFALGAYNEKGKVVFIGSCSAIGKDPETKVGDVIEVAYLYWTGNSLYQPRMLRIRTDKPPSDCLISQFPEYHRLAR